MKQKVPARCVQQGDRITHLGGTDVTAGNRGPLVVDEAKPGLGGSAEMEVHHRDGECFGIVTSGSTPATVAR